MVPLSNGNDSDQEYIQPPIEDVGKAFIEWAKDFWGLDRVWKEWNNNKPPNTEGAPWEYVESVFIIKINEFVTSKSKE